ncbi:MAG: hypothetical protein ACXWN2_02970 [Candidatus Limnocylindrales bacterium]
MGTPTREWPWPWEGYATVRLAVSDGIMPPTRDQVVAQVEAVVKAARSVKDIEDGVRAVRNPYLPIECQVAAETDPLDPAHGHVDIEVRLRGR